MTMAMMAMMAMMARARANKDIILPPSSHQRNQSCLNFKLIKLLDRFALLLTEVEKRYGIHLHALGQRLGNDRKKL